MGMIFTNDADKGVAVQSTVTDRGTEQAREVTNGGVDVTGIQPLLQLFGRQRQRTNTQFRRTLVEHPHQSGQKDHLANVGHAQHQLALRVLGDKARGWQYLIVYQRQNALDRLGDLQGSGGGLHTSRGTYEQGVIEQHSQLGQGKAHGRLAKPHQITRLSHALLAVQGIEDLQQVQVDISDIHILDFIYKRN